MKILQYDSKIGFTVEFDPYIPVNVKVEGCGTHSGTVVYWRTGDFKKNLVEVGLDKQTGKLYSITLVICDKAESCDYSFTFPAKMYVGSPIMSLEDTADKAIVDKVGELTVQLSKNCIYIWFSNVNVESCIRNDNLVFFLDGTRNWVGFCIQDIKQEEYVQLLESLHIKQAG